MLRRALAGTDVEVALPLLNADGEQGTPAAAPDVTVVDSSGEAITGSPFASTLDGDDDVTFTLPAEVTGTLDTYELSATADDAGGIGLVGAQTIQTVGGFLVTLADLRTRVAKFSDQSAYAVPALRQLRTAVEQRIERSARRKFTRQARRLVTRVDVDGRVPLPDIDVATLRSLTIDGTAVDVADVEVSDGDWGWLQLASGARWTCGDEAVAIYEYGLAVPPQPIVDAALMLASESEVDTTMPVRATAMSSEHGTFRITVAGRDGHTGIPDVDQAIHDWGRSEPVVG